MEKDLISIIIPAYNCGKFIEKCLTSIQKQSYKHFEVIIVDDGSTDITREIVNEFTSCDERFLYHYQDNQGVSAARNKGLDISRGEYIAFIDSDDWVSEDYLSEAINVAKGYDLDIVLGGTEVVYDDHIRRFPPLETNEVSIFDSKSGSYEYKILSNGIVDDQELNKTFTSGPWCKLFRRDAISDIKFETHLIRGEDVVFNVLVARNSEKVGLVKHIWYYYRKNSESVTSKYNPKVMDSTVVFLERLYELYSHNKKALPYLIIRVVKQLYGAMSIGPCSRLSPLSIRKQISSINYYVRNGVIGSVLSEKVSIRKLPGSNVDKVICCFAKRKMSVFLWFIIKIMSYYKLSKKE